MPKPSTLTLGKRRIAVSNVNKVLYPAAGFTKGQVVDYYLRVSAYLLPHLKNRPVTLVRYPDGVDEEFFYEKNVPAFAPPWIKTFPVPRSEGGEIRFILVNDVATLAWVANLAALELHPYLHRAPRIDRPASVVFDLDPGEGADVLTCARVAFLLRELLRRLELECFPKVSGSKGIQIHVPLNRPVTYEQTSAFAHAVADMLTLEHPELVLSKMAKALRKGKVFIDWSQNSDHKTTVAVYSLRAKRPHPFVSMPIEWEELKRAVRRKEATKLFFEPEAALKRLKKQGDLFAPVLELKQKLPSDFVRHLQATESDAAAPKRTSRPLSRNSKTAGTETRSSRKSLAEYSAKRDFGKTREPGPVTAPRKAGKKRRFVVQKHAARQLHYDFRLEMDGVLKSWAVPKGVPLKQKEVRGAFATEDHPVGYLDFEGIIPQGQYGGGTVMVWDIGTFDILDGNYFSGKLTVALHGHKLEGEWTLVRTKGDDRKPAWLLIKAHADARPIAARRRDASALTGRTMEQIKEDKAAVWQSNRV